METLAHDSRIERIQAAHLPFSLIGRTDHTEGISYVDIDFGDAVRTSLAHLVELGHRCVALFNFPQAQLDAGYTSAIIARDAFEDAASDLDVRGIHIDLPASGPGGVRRRRPPPAFEPDCTAAITTGWQFTACSARCAPPTFTCRTTSRSSR